MRVSINIAGYSWPGAGPGLRAGLTRIARMAERTTGWSVRPTARSPCNARTHRS
ncbi:MAG: hypothetical protein QOE54_2144 [Streptosporangiaceae bacterium]|nr:hypothetical protein [Streptosporangiaceae bacterium]